MLKRRLTALEHPTPDIDINDRKIFASTILWLEDRKIRFYKIDERKPLRNVEDLNEWELFYDQYRVDLQMPKFQTPIEEVTWLTSLAVQYDFNDQFDKYKSINSKDVLAQRNISKEPILKDDNSFNYWDPNHPDFINGCKKIFELLEIAHHPDHLVQLKAAAIIIKERLGKSSEDLEIVTGEIFPFEKGNDILADDKDLDYPIRIMRLIEIHKLRDLQTKINEIIVSIQELTAEPKTDTKLGKVGTT